VIWCTESLVECTYFPTTKTPFCLQRPKRLVRQNTLLSFITLSLYTPRPSDLASLVSHLLYFQVFQKLITLNMPIDCPSNCTETLLLYTLYILLDMYSSSCFLFLLLIHPEYPKCFFITPFLNSCVLLRLPLRKSTSQSTESKLKDFLSLSQMLIQPFFPHLPSSFLTSRNSADFPQRTFSTVYKFIYFSFSSAVYSFHCTVYFKYVVLI